MKLYLCYFYLQKLISKNVLNVIVYNQYYPTMRFCGPETLSLTIVASSNQTQYFVNQNSSLKDQPHNMMLLPDLLYITQDTTLDSVLITTQKPKNQTNASNPEQSSKLLYELTSQRGNGSELCIKKNIKQQRWIYRFLKPQTFQQIKIGDIIKIGCFEMLVKIISIPKNSVEKKDEPLVFNKFGFIDPEFNNLQNQVPSRNQRMKKIKNGQEQSISESQNQQKQCRICFDNFESEKNPLISLCRCSGSVKFSHYECMKQWISKCSEKHQSQTCAYFRFKKQCDICKETLPINFSKNGKMYQFPYDIDLESLKSPYIVFQLLNRSNNSDSQIILMKFIKNQNGQILTIGYSGDSDLCFIDNTVDQFHSEIQFKDNKFYIADKSTVFGTMLKLRKQTSFSAKQGIRLQFQTIVLQLKRQPSLFEWFCPDEQCYIYLQEDKSIQRHKNGFLL